MVRGQKNSLTDPGQAKFTLVLYLLSGVYYLKSTEIALIQFLFLDQYDLGWHSAIKPDHPGQTLDFESFFGLSDLVPIGKEARTSDSQRRSEERQLRQDQTGLLGF